MNRINRQLVLVSWPKCIYGSPGKPMTVEHLIPKYWLRSIDAPLEIYNDYIHLFPAGRQINMIRGHFPITDIVPVVHRGVIGRALCEMRTKYPLLDPIMHEVLPYARYVEWIQYPICLHEKKRYELLKIHN